MGRGMREESRLPGLADLRTSAWKSEMVDARRDDVDLVVRREDRETVRVTGGIGLGDISSGSLDFRRGDR